MTALLTSLLPAVLTFLAAAFAAWVTWLVASSKARTDIITTGRQNWIGFLRDDLAELIQARAALRDCDAPISPEQVDPDGIEKRQAILQRVRLLRARVLLRMDETPKKGRENPQIELSATVRAFTDEDRPYSAILADELIANGQTVLDRAWNQVKRLK